MKTLIKLSMLLVLFGVSTTAVLAQYDDVYYDPERNNNRTYTDRRQVPPPATPAPSQDYGYEEGYDDEEYDYYYTSRLRRFHRPYAGFDYFDPIYVDAYYYDAFARPGAAVLIYDDPFGYYGWNAWNRWNRWNGLGFGGWNRWNRWNRWNSWNSWAWSDPFCAFNNPGLSFGFGWNRWNNFGWNNWGWNNFGWNNFGGNAWGFGGPFWANNWNTLGWGGNNFYNINNNFFGRGNENNNRNIYYGPRTGGAGIGTQPGIDNPNGRSPRFTADPDIKSNPATPRPDYSGGRRLDEAPSYTRDRTVPPSTNPRTTTDPGRGDTYGSPNSADRYRDARGNINNTPGYDTRRPEVADPFAGGRRTENTDRARTYTDDRQNLRPGAGSSDPYNSRPRSYDTQERNYNSPRSMDNGNNNLDRARTYTPDRSYERSREYTAPRNTPSTSSPRSNSGWDSGRSSSGNSGWDSGRSNTISSPRNFDGGGSRMSSPSPGPSSSGSGSSSGSSSSGGRSGGRQ